MVSHRTPVQSRRLSGLWEKPGMDTLQRIALSRLRENPNNPRNSYGDLTEMARTIESGGIIEPIIVRKTETGLEIVAGHRRARAAKIAGLKEVNVIVRDYDEQEALVVALIENTARESLDPLEIAAGYAKLRQQHDMTPEQIAAKVGASKATIYNSLTLLELTEPVKEALRQGKVTASVAYRLVSVRGERLQAQALADVLKLSKNGEPPAARAVERLIRSRYLTVAKSGQSKRQREVKQHGAEVALRRRVVERLVHVRIPELLERKPQLDATDLRLHALALSEILGESARTTFQRRGERPDRLSKVGPSQLRSLISQLIYGAWAKVEEDGSYSAAAKMLAKTHDLSLSEMERNLEGEDRAAALFAK